MSLRVRQGFTVEVTESDSTSSLRQPLASDTVIDLREGKLFTIEEIVFGAGPRITLPISLGSQARERILGTGAVLTASRDIEGVLSGMSVGLMDSCSRSGYRGTRCSCRDYGGWCVGFLASAAAVSP